MQLVNAVTQKRAQQPEKTEKKRETPMYHINFFFTVFNSFLFFYTVNFCRTVEGYLWTFGKILCKILVVPFI